MNFIKKITFIFSFILGLFILTSCSLEDQIKDINTKIGSKVQTTTSFSTIVYFNDSNDLMFNKYTRHPIARLYFKEMLYDSNGNETKDAQTFRQESLSKNRREGNTTVTNIVKFNDLYYLKEKDTGDLKKYAEMSEYHLVFRVSVLLDSTNTYHTLYEESFDITKDVTKKEQPISSAADLAYYFYLDKKESLKDPFDFSDRMIYKLTKDIDLEGAEIESLTGSDDFLATLDGDGHTISNFKLNFKGASSYAGLIRKNFGVIKNLTLKDVTVDFKDSPYNLSFGVLCGTNNGVIENCTLDHITVNYEQNETSDDYSQYFGLFAGSTQLSTSRFEIKIIQTPIRFVGNTVKNSTVNFTLLDPRNVYIGGAVGYFGTQKTNLYNEYVIKQNSVNDDVTINVDHNVKKQASSYMNLYIGGFSAYLDHDASDIYVGSSMHLKASYKLISKSSTPKTDPFPDTPSKAETDEDLVPNINNGLKTYNVYTAGVVAYLGSYVSKLSDIAFVGSISSEFNRSYVVSSSLIFGYAKKNHLGDSLILKNIQLGSLTTSFNLVGNVNHELKQDNNSKGIVVDPITTEINYGVIFGSTDSDFMVDQTNDLNANLVYDFNSSATVDGAAESKAKYIEYKESISPDTSLFSAWLKAKLSI